jgi:hypothetical protein
MATLRTLVVALEWFEDMDGFKPRWQASLQFEEVTKKGSEPRQSTTLDGPPLPFLDISIHHSRSGEESQEFRLSTVTSKWLSTARAGPRKAKRGTESVLVG